MLLRFNYVDADRASSFILAAVYYFEHSELCAYIYLFMD